MVTYIEKKIAKKLKRPRCELLIDGTHVYCKTCKQASLVKFVDNLLDECPYLEDEQDD